MLETFLLAGMMAASYLIGTVVGWNNAAKAMKSIDTPTPHVLWDGKPNSPDA